MKVNVDPDLCIACGVCEEICPEVFELGDNDFAQVIGDPEDYEDEVQEAADACPTEAIIIED
ncbi:MAG: ferredoxin [Firmicutes bacterium]|nr:ferredoxin [Bacillota bacterium]MDD4264046.1 ferredoxin [Bacillota bacterium]MDD4693709.1 ferredoxin [Bacillota bacterium]